MCMDHVYPLFPSGSISGNRKRGTDTFLVSVGEGSAFTCERLESHSRQRSVTVFKCAWIIGTPCFPAGLFLGTVKGVQTHTVAVRLMNQEIPRDAVTGC